MVEIDENMVRVELTVLERAEQMKRRKEIYEALHPETKAGKAQASGMNKSLGRNVSEESSVTFADDAASKLGVSPRSIQIRT